MNRKIPLYQPFLHGKEKEYVMECVESSWISSKGKFVELFENSFANYVGAPYALSVCNATVGLHLAMVTLGITTGDEVIVPSFTYVASVNAIAYVGAKPIFVDSEPDFWQMDCNQIRQKITKKTKAILAVHLYGHPCNMKELQKIAQEYDLLLIEDCAEAIGSFYQNKHVGIFGDVGVFSFYGNKTITTGEGGMLVFNKINFFERARHLRSQAVVKWKEYWHDEIGYNYRMTNIAAAIGLAQLEQIDIILAKKKLITEWYKANLKNNLIEIHQEDSQNVIHSYWLVSCLVKNSEECLLLRKNLATSGIETRPLFHPIHTMPMYSSPDIKYIVAEDLGSRGMNLPSYPDLIKEDVDYICDQIKVFLKRELDNKSISNQFKAVQF